MGWWIMNNLRKTIKAHFVHPTDGMVGKFTIEHAPRVGDELRFPGEIFFKVARLVWVYDEPEAQFTRLNIEVHDIKKDDVKGGV